MSFNGAAIAKKIGIGFGGLTSVMVMGVGYFFGSSFGMTEKIGSSTEHTRVHYDERTRMSAFNTIAPKYDKEIGMDEFFMGMLLLRRWLLRSAVGNTLEVGAGTGRNLPYYKRCDSVTFTDQSREMLDQIEAKLPLPSPRLYGSTPTAEVKQMSTSKLAFPDNSFDTVVSTFGLCSYEDPLGALSEMQRVCKPEGRILLLEHGQGTWGFINRWLAMGAANHAKHYGCVWNKPIAALVDEAGLSVLRSRRWHFGTTYSIVATGQPREGYVSPNTAPKVAKAKRGVFTE